MGGIINIKEENYNQSLLLRKFNDRDEEAFSQVYILLYNKLFYFAIKLFTNTEIVASDKIQDIFLNIWENKKIKFTSLSHIKSYIYLSIQNSFRDYLSHRTHVDDYARKVINNSDLYTTEIIETEVMSILYESIDQLPDDCGEIMRLHMSGMDMKDIAKHLNKPQSTIYRQKNRAISILSHKLPKELMIVIVTLF